MIDWLTNIVRTMLDMLKNLIISISPEWSWLSFIITSIILSFLLLKVIGFDVKMSEIRRSWLPVMVIASLIFIIFLLI